MMWAGRSTHMERLLAFHLLIRPKSKSTVPHPFRRFYREMGGRPKHFLRVGPIERGESDGRVREKDLRVIT